MRSATWRSSSSPTEWPEGVVDDLEAVEVQEEDGEPLVVAVRLRHGERQAVVEEQPVGQVRQRIVKGEVLDLLLGPLALGDVDRRALDDRQAAVGPLDEVLALEDPDEAAVLALQAELVVGQGLALEELGERGLPVLRLDVEVPGGLLEDFLARGVSEDAREGLVAVEDPALERRAVDAGEVALEEGAVPLLRETQGFFDLAAAADVGDRADAERRPARPARQERRGVVPVQGRAVPAQDPVLLEERLAGLEVAADDARDARAVLRVDRLLPGLDGPRELAVAKPRIRSTSPNQ